MAFELNPIAVSSAPLLRAIQGQLGDWLTQTDLARVAGREPKNMTRDLATVRKAGLVTEGEIALTEAGKDQLDALDRATADPAAALDGIGAAFAFHHELYPDPDQPRKDFTSDQAIADLDELRDSLIARGRILQPIAVRPHPAEPGFYLITDGERRWRAAGLAIEGSYWPLDTRIPITVQDTDARETRLSQLTANMVRADMSPLEEADAFADLIETHGMTTAGIAAEIGMSQKLVQNRLRLRQLSADDRARMALPEDDPDHLGYKAALRSLMTSREGGAGEGTLSEGESGSPAPDTALVIPAQAGTPQFSGNPGQLPAPDPGEVFDRSITLSEALTLIEIADWIERAREPSIGSGHYAPIHAVPTTPVPRRLLERGLIAFRSHGPLHHVTVRYSFEGLTEWLTAQGLYRDRTAALHEFRTRAHDARHATDLAEADRYATAWLNPPSTALDALAEAEPELVAQVIADHGDAAEDAPALIPPTDVEREAQWRMEQARAAEARDADTIQRFSQMMLASLTQARTEDGPHRAAWDAEGTGGTMDALVRTALDALSDGNPARAAAALAILAIRGGAMGAAMALQRAATA